MSAIPQIRRLVILLATIALVSELPSAIGQEAEPLSRPQARQRIADVPARYREIVRVVHLAGPIAEGLVVPWLPLLCERERQIEIHALAMKCGGFWSHDNDDRFPSEICSLLEKLELGFLFMDFPDLDAHGELATDELIRKVLTSERITRELEGINLSCSEVTDASKDALASFPNLRTLDLSGTRVTTEVVRELRRRMPKTKVFKEFSYEENKALHQQLASGASLTALGKGVFSIAFHEQTPTFGCLHAASMTAVPDPKTFRKVTDDTLAVLQSLDKVTRKPMYVELDHSALTDASLVWIASIKHLKGLDISSRTRISRAAVKALRATRPKLEVTSPFEPPLSDSWDPNAAAWAEYPD